MQNPQPPINGITDKLACIELTQKNNQHTPIQSPPNALLSTNGNSTPTSSKPIRTGIPRYAIPYQRLDRPSDTFAQKSPHLLSPTNGHSGSSEPPASPMDSIVSEEGGSSNNFDLQTAAIGESVGRQSNRYCRAQSEDFFRAGESESDLSSNFSSSGQPRVISAKVNSLANAHFQPGGGNVKIFDSKLDFRNAQSKCDSKANLKHKPGGGDIAIVVQKLKFKEISKPKVNSLQNSKHVPGGGDVKIDVQKVDFREAAKPKIASLKNAQYRPGGGDVQIESRKLEFTEKAKPRVASLKNANHRAGGGNVQIFNQKPPWLVYNKPKLDPEERARINKHTTAQTPTNMHNY